ncbi:Cell cycle serine/threonine-protein kinase cdc5/MSD2 [Perkinsus olseni]|uniref:Cell cycle serine/threonine-protein kinase cdc5/MSD2 n=1 Tax=Perkinsus olseni TaxID=32597 RepID=A0A7J6NFZ2_PEROL|nr:Cell cycle serine/threonine-protein kinase cdc5/MSD2 [Perkinsus olseni]
MSSQRILIKGGVWKNSEDEILKAAVMKYGLNNWSRVASLLVRKTPSQCKARWYEWLDPSVKKTEWSRDEEARLLHLAKIFPCQWRTIAQTVGRTAHQCLEHYERLLDRAQGRDEDDENDPRKLRPGEIDPNPEIRPAKADPIDMDDDEKEMLQEARARLANVRGKKAKRKAREKAMDDTRRLAKIQKRREMQAAGIRVSRYRKRRYGIDYGQEIPFETVPMLGDHIPGPEETPKPNFDFRGMTLAQLDMRTRKQEEMRNKRDDEKKIKRIKERQLPKALEMANNLNDAATVRNVSSLSLPAPQLSDSQLMDIVRAGTGGVGGSGSGEVTDGLVTNAADIATMQSVVETPAGEKASGSDVVFEEAKNAVMRNSMMTPLEGEENPQMMPGSKFEGLMPNMGNVATPNILADRLSSVRESKLQQTPLGGRATPSGGAIERSQRRGEKRERSTVDDLLSALPEPEMEVTASLPEGMDLVKEDGEVRASYGRNFVPEVADAGDLDAQRKREALERQKEEEVKKCPALQQKLPRSVVVPTSVEMITKSDDIVKGDLGDAEEITADMLARVRDELDAEYVALLYRDEKKYPGKGIRPPTTNPNRDVLRRSGQEFSAKEIAWARKVVAAEASESLEHGKPLVAGYPVGEREVQEAMAKLEDDSVFGYVPSEKRYRQVRDSTTSKSTLSMHEAVQMLQDEVEYMQTKLLAKEVKKHDKMIGKINKLTLGHKSQYDQMVAACPQEWHQIVELTAQRDTLLSMQITEEAGALSRRQAITDTVAEEKRRNRMLHSRYREVAELRQRLLTTVPGLR